MRRITRTILYVALTVWGWLEPSRAVAQTKIRLATLLPRGSSHYQILESMGQQWRSASSGRINLAIYADGTRSPGPRC
jgi:TRAP-type C4-dicarboxylate transport system substrate-binding protein